MSAAAAQRAAPAREFVFEAADHAAIARLAYDEAGILLPPGKSHLVYSRLVRRVRERKVASFADYIALLDHDAAERMCAIDALTTNHTSFFREKHHFDHFMADCWPPLLSRLTTGGRVRLWSAACSSGEEPYTLAMALVGTDRRTAQLLARRDFRLLATDLSTEILAAARAGRYRQETALTVPAELRAASIERAGDGIAIHPDLKGLIDFRRLNLLQDWPMRGSFDAIFCRNVMIYFDEPTKARLQSRLADRLAPGGFLYIGHSERLAAEVAPRFACVGRTTFRKLAA